MSTLSPHQGLSIDEWRHGVISGAIGNAEFFEWFQTLNAGDPAWIHLASWEHVLVQLSELRARLESTGGDAAGFPLFGVPCAVKDNIDVGGWPTTAACPAFSFVPERDATVVALLKNAGAIVIGKTNLDQFATGLVGTRSPYGVVPSAFRSEYIAGGSSSGSASVVTRGMVPFTLGTDTAGSGRVPAAFGNIVGLKPTRGLFSTKGVVPACRTLDCVSVFAHTVSDVALVGRLLSRFDADDPYSRRAQKRDVTLPGPAVSPRLGVLAPLEFFGDERAEAAYRESIDVLHEDGFEFSEVASAPFFELAKLLYAGPWVAERSLSAGELMERSPPVMDPIVRGILENSRGLTAEDAFRFEYQRAALSARINEAFRGLDAIVVPTTGTTYTTQEVKRDPIETNARLGTYTNFTNLADLCALAVPGRFRADGLPTGLTFLGPAFADLELLPLAERAHLLLGVSRGATGRPLPASRGSAVSGETWEGDRVQVAVVGAHLSGMPLNHQLTGRGARLVRSTTTASRYRLFVLPGSQPLKPGLMRVGEGFGIALEVWEMPVAAFGEFCAEVPPPLGIGSVQLCDDTWVKGFICEPCGFEGAEDISSYGGFFAYMNRARPETS